MPQDTDENSKTVVDETTIVVEDKKVVAVDSDSEIDDVATPQAKPEELEEEETQKEVDEEEEFQPIVRAASGSPDSRSGRMDNVKLDRSDRR